MAEGERPVSDPMERPAARLTFTHAAASGEGIPLSAVKPLLEGAERRRSKQVANTPPSRRRSQPDDMPKAELSMYCVLPAFGNSTRDTDQGDHAEVSVLRDRKSSESPPAATPMISTSLSAALWSIQSSSKALLPRSTIWPSCQQRSGYRR